MPAPATYTYSAASLVAAHTALLGEIDAGTAAGKIKLYDDSDLLLATITLSDPAGTVNGTTGQLALTAPSSATGVAQGACTYGTITDSDGTVVLSIPAQTGTSAVSGKLVLSSTGILVGSTVDLISCVIG